MAGLFKRFCVLIMCAVVAAPARADIATVKYLHDYIKQRWNLDIPYVGHGNVVSMKHLMRVVDISNNLLNNNGGTNYADTANTNIVATGASDTAVETLIRPEYKFFFTPATDEGTYTFQIGAAGTFYIDWGDGGKIETIKKVAVGLEQISHTYTDKPASAHEIKLAGRASMYATGNTAAVRFYDGTTENKNGLKSMRGCLGCIFGTITDTSVAENARQPRFYQTFRSNVALTSALPAELFRGVTGAPVSAMFYYTFANSPISGQIPGDLFSGLNGAPTSSLFQYTFSGNKFNGEIPENLFAGIKGAPASNMFTRTFNACVGLTKIPENLFAGISGVPAVAMFNGTFANCGGINHAPPAKLFAGIKGPPATNMFSNLFQSSGITGPLPAELFSGISGAPAANMYSSLFYSCGSLTGAIPPHFFGTFDGPAAKSMFASTFFGTKVDGTVPATLFAGIYGPPASGMFARTFAYAHYITGIAPGLFAGISGPAAPSMFASTFFYCGGLTGEIPEDLFGDIYGAPQEGMFGQTFRRCGGLTGPSARVGAPGAREFLYERWPDTCVDDVSASDRCYEYANQLADRADIPSNWGGPKEYDGPVCGADDEDDDDTEE